jgi:hypothetical protein
VVRASCPQELYKLNAVHLSNLWVIDKLPTTSTTLIRFEDISISIIFLENPLTIIKVFSQKKPKQILSKNIVQKIVENCKP